MILENKEINYIIEKLYQLRVQAEFEDRNRGKKRYISKVSAYQDLINFFKEIDYEYNNEQCNDIC